MKEKIGDIWKANCNIICITTNGIVKKNGELVMGKGIALQAKQRYPRLAKHWGRYVNMSGNVPHMYEFNDVKLLSFPTKNNWMDKSDMSLIKSSTQLIANRSDLWYYKSIALPRPGCGNGGLKWEDVKKEIEPILDDRFIVYSLEE
uniref:Macro domain-containing protein n=1 Tax=viral metagenome TaxID=1070528 RepID=A0A6M3X5E3_9ZZZZ